MIRFFSLCITSTFVFLLTVLTPNALAADAAQPLTVEGVENLHQVTANLYRSGQPSRQGMQALEKMGLEFNHEVQF